MFDNNIPIGMLQNDELYNIISGLALSGGTDIKTLYLIAHSAGIQEQFLQNMIKHKVIRQNEIEHLLSGNNKRLGQ